MLQIYNAKDNFISNLGPYLTSQGIIYASSCAGTPQQYLRGKIGAFLKLIVT